MRKKKIINIVITISVVLGVFVLIGSVLGNNKKKNAAKTAVVAQTSNGDVAVRISPVQKQSIELDFSANGNFQPAQQMNFASENSGQDRKSVV